MVYHGKIKKKSRYRAKKISVLLNVCIAIAMFRKQVIALTKGFLEKCLQKFRKYLPILTGL